jgi:hypothetical protein
MPIATREQEVDIAYALETSPFVVGSYALSLPASAVEHPDALPFGVAVRPYTPAALASTHFALLQATHHGVAGRVLYANADWPPSRLFTRGRRLVVDPHERHEARARFLLRSTENVRRWRLEEQAMIAALERAFERGGGEAHIRVSLQSGEFEVIPDPFPSEKLPPARVLVIDRDTETVEVLRQLGEVEVVAPQDGWVALEHLLRGDFDLVLCAFTFGDWSGAKLYSMAAKGCPDVSHRFVFIARKAEVDAAPPSSALSRVVSRPVDSDTVRRLVAQLRRR